MAYRYFNQRPLARKNTPAAKDIAMPRVFSFFSRLRMGRAGVDKPLLLLILLLSGIGSVMIFSASYANAAVRYGDSFYFIKRQVLWLFIGCLVMLLFSYISRRTLEKYTLPLFLLTLLLLVLVLIVGQSGGGAQRWLGIGALTFQPSELAKTALVLLLARHFARHSDSITDYRTRGLSFRVGTLAPLGYIAVFCLLVALEKHLSCIIILGMLGVSMMFAGGSRPRYLALFGSMFVAGVGALAIFTEYTKRRIMIWQNPEAFPLDGGWQTLQGLMAIGSGGFFGLGLGNSRLKYSYVAEPQNDFIFTVTCEELGFLGAFFILSLFLLFILRGYTVALRHPDPFSGLVAFGITTKVGIQVLLNIAVVTNSIPNTGISLPFFSYGGSSLVMLFAEMGILLSFSRTSRIAR